MTPDLPRDPDAGAEPGLDRARDRGPDDGPEPGVDSAPSGAFTPGIVLFMTGLSGAGKTTIAEALAEELRAEGVRVEVVDGDVLRRAETAGLGYDRASRDANVRRGAELATAMAGDGAVVVSALMAPFEGSRREARELAASAGVPFRLVYVHAPLEVAEARDPKGLYRRARAGEIQHFIGLDEPYEAPLDADLVIDTATTGVPEAVRQLRELLRA